MLSNRGLRRLLRVPWTARRSEQSIQKEINPEYSLEGLMLKLKLQYFVHLIRRTDSLEKTLMLGKIEGQRRGRPRMRWLDSVTDSMDMGFGQTLGDTGGQRSLVCFSPWSHRVRHDLVTQQHLWETILPTTLIVPPAWTIAMKLVWQCFGRSSRSTTGAMEKDGWMSWRVIIWLSRMEGAGLLNEHLSIQKASRQFGT